MESADPITNGDEPAPAPRTPHWLNGLLSAESLAVGAFALALLSSMGGTALELFAFGFGFPGEPGTDHQWWFMLPTIILSVLAILLGVLGIRQATLQAAARWPFALAGGGALLALGALAVTLITWATQPDFPSPFEEFPFPFPSEPGA